MGGENGTHTSAVGHRPVHFSPLFENVVLQFYAKILQGLCRYLIQRRIACL